jgi:hypothetical protein
VAPVEVAVGEPKRKRMKAAGEEVTQEAEIQGRTMAMPIANLLGVTVTRGWDGNGNGITIMEIQRNI